MVPEEGPLDVPSPALGMSWGEVVVRWRRREESSQVGGSWRCSGEDSSRLLPGTKCPAPSLQMFLLQPPGGGGGAGAPAAPSAAAVGSQQFLFPAVALHCPEPSDAHQSPLWLAVSLPGKSEAACSSVRGLLCC